MLIKHARDLLDRRGALLDDIEDSADDATAGRTDPRRVVSAQDAIRDRLRDLRRLIDRELTPMIERRTSARGSSPDISQQLVSLQQQIDQLRAAIGASAPDPPTTRRTPAPSSQSTD